MINGYLIIVLLLIGIGGLILSKNLIKKVIALNIINSAIVILFIYLGSLSGDEAPILLEQTGSIVDPVPQALMLTAIVVGICLTALALSLTYRLQRIYGTLDIYEIEKKAREDAG